MNITEMGGSYFNKTIVLKHIQGKASVEEQEQLLNWLNKDKKNKDWYFELKDIWDSSLHDELEFDPIIQNEWEKFSHGIKKAGQITFFRSVYYRILPYAAVSLITIGISWLFFHRTDQPEYGKVQTSSQNSISVKVPYGEKTHILLADGTYVWLNSGTTLKYSTDFGQSNRDVYLDGEALFEVKRDPERPFIVSVANTRLKVLGTSFNVRNYADEPRIITSLLSGSLEFRHTGQSSLKPVIMKPSQRITFDKNTEAMRIESGTNLNDEIAWKSDQLIFKETSFAEMGKTLERWYNIKLNIPDDLLNLRFTGKFIYHESIEDVLKAIAQTTPIKYTIRNREVTLFQIKP